MSIAPNVFVHRMNAFLFMHVVASLDVYGSPMHVLQSFDQPNATSEGELFYTRHYNSRLSERQTAVTFQSLTALSGRAMQVNYTVEQSAEWGGFVDFGFILRDERVHDCSGATALAFWYNNVVKSSAAGRVHFRFVLLEGSNCSSACSEMPGSALENYYSFHHILDDEPGWQQVSLVPRICTTSLHHVSVPHLCPPSLYRVHALRLPRLCLPSLYHVSATACLCSTSLCRGSRRLSRVFSGKHRTERR